MIEETKENSNTQERTEISGHSWRNFAFSTALLACGIGAIAGIRGCGTEKADLDSVSNLHVDEDMMAWGTDFTLTSEGKAIGNIEIHHYPVTLKFSFADADGNHVASATRRFLSWGTVIDITGANEEVLGTVEERYLGNMISPFPTYTIKDATGVTIGISSKLEMLGNYIKIKDPNGQELASITQSALDQGYADWDISTNGKIDKRLIIFIPAFQTYSNNSK